MQVFHNQHQRSAGCQPEEQAVEGFEQASFFGLMLTGGNILRRPVRRGQLGQQPGQLRIGQQVFVRRAGQSGPQQIDEWRIRISAVLLKAAAGQDAEILGLGPGADLGDQAAFADSGFPADQHQTPAPAVNRSEGLF